MNKLSGIDTHLIDKLFRIPAERLLIVSDIDSANDGNFADGQSPTNAIDAIANSRTNSLPFRIKLKSVDKKLT